MTIEEATMNENIFEIKEKRSGYFAKGIVFLILAVLTLFIALFPYAFPYLKINTLLFLIPGGIGFIAFAILFVSHLNRECVPGNAMVLTDNGFTHFSSTGDLEIEWTNVASIRLYGQSDSPCLGIYLENVDIVSAKLKNKYSETIRFNIEEGLAPILIYQSDVRIKLTRLKEILTEYVRNSRNVEKKDNEKSKHNPFTTEDVLRAFGKLPKDEVADDSNDVINNETVDQEGFDGDLNEALCESFATDDTISNEENNTESSESNSDESMSESDSEKNTFPCGDTIIFNTSKDEEEEEEEEENDESADDVAEDTHCTNETSADECDVDDIAILLTETKLETSSSSDDDLPEEFIDLLSKAKSTKINELEKILNEKDIPYSYGKSGKLTGEIDSSKVNEESPSEAEVVINDKDDIVPLVDVSEAAKEEDIKEPEKEALAPLNETEDDATEHKDDIDVNEFPFVDIVDIAKGDSNKKGSEEKSSPESSPVTNTPAPAVKEDDDISFELTLEAMINEALDKKKAEVKKDEPVNLDNSIFESTETPKKKPKSKNNEEYPELIVIDDSDSAKKDEKSKDDDFVIPNLNDDE